MPRIIHGPSEEIKTVRVINQDAAVAKDFIPAPFKGMRVSDSFTAAEVEQKMNEARAMGRREGFAEAEKKISAPVRDSLQTVENILDEISRFRRELFKESEQEILELVQAICRKIISTEISIHPEKLKNMLMEALKHLEHQKKIQVRLNPADFERFNGVKEDFLNAAKGLTELDLMADDTIPEGSALLRTATTSLELNLNQMIDHLMQQVRSEATSASQVNDEGDRIT